MSKAHGFPIKIKISAAPGVVTLRAIDTDPPWAYDLPIQFFNAADLHNFQNELEAAFQTAFGKEPILRRNFNLPCPNCPAPANHFCAASCPRYKYVPEPGGDPQLLRLNVNNCEACKDNTRVGATHSLS